MTVGRVININIIFSLVHYLYLAFSIVVHREKNNQLLETFLGYNRAMTLCRSTHFIIIYIYSETFIFRKKEKFVGKYFNTNFAYVLDCLKIYWD